MIRITRPSKPRILENKADEWRASLLAADTIAKRNKAEKKYRHKDIKKLLVQMFSGKCAYCESKITHIDYGHIEHFRPKRGTSGRPELAFEWSNLLLACGICNGAEHKSDHFPEANENGPILDPCVDELEKHLSFHYDPITKLASVYGKTPRGVTTETLLGLNRVELRSYRSKRIRHLLALAQYATTDAEAAALLDEAKQSIAEYAAFARALL